MTTRTTAALEHRRYVRRLWLVRTIAAASILGILVTAVIDLRTTFWVDHPMLAAYVSGLLLIALGSAVLNEILAARARRRWQAVAALALIQMRDTIRSINADLNHRVAAQSTGLQGLLTSGEQRAGLAEQIRAELDEADPIAVTWSPVVINDGTYDFVLNTYVTLLNRLWRVLWALSGDNGQRADGPGDDAIAEELADLLTDMSEFDRRVTGIVRDLLPWPESFGAAP